LAKFVSRSCLVFFPTHYALSNRGNWSVSTPVKRLHKSMPYKLDVDELRQDLALVR
jgi:hypothetical protein